MTPAQVQRFARAGARDFAIPAASEQLLLAGLLAPPGSDTRRRARRALEQLSPDVHDPDATGNDPLVVFGLAVGVVLLECIRHADQRERARLANLLGAVCREASAIAARRGESTAA